MEMKPAAEPATGFPVDAAPAGAWSSGLFDCFDDCGLCTYGLRLNISDPPFLLDRSP